MRRQDEILTLYPSQKPPARKFLLTQMEDLGLAFDSEELLELYQNEIRDPEPLIRHQALSSIGQFLPSHLKKRYALTEQSTGVWTTFGQDGESRPSQLILKPVIAPEDVTPVTQAALLSAMPMARGLCALIDSSEGWPRTAALLALSRFKLHKLKDWLQSEVSSRPGDLEVALTLTRMAGNDSRETVHRVIRSTGGANPDAYLLLRDLTGDADLDLLMESADATDGLGRMNLARVLGASPSIDASRVDAALTKLIARGEPWVIIACLGSLEARRDAGVLPRLIEIYQRHDHEFIRIQCVKTAGGLPGPDSVAFCFHTLRKGSDRIRAVALESLVRLKAEPEALRKAATVLVKSPHLKMRINALIAAVDPEEALKFPPLVELLLSEDALSRLEGAFCLGYLQSRRALGILAALTQKDPSTSVRRQAVKSLSKYPARYSLAALVPLLSGADSRLALTAARIMTRYEGNDAQVVCEEIKSSMPRVTSAFERAMRYWIMGALASKITYPSAGEILEPGLEETDPGVLRGVLEGWILLGTEKATVREKLGKIAARSDGRLVSRARMALWNSGDLEVPSTLEKMLTSDDQESVKYAVECALEMGLLFEEIGTASRFPALAARLLEKSRQPDFPAAVAAEIENRALEPRPAPTLVVEEPDFEVRRDLRRESRENRELRENRIRDTAPVKSRAGTIPDDEKPTESNVSLEGLNVAQLESFLERPGVAQQAVLGLQDKLARFSYLVTEGLAPGGYLAQLWSTPRGKAAILMPLVLYVMAITYWALPGTAGTGGPVGLPGFLWVTHVETPPGARGKWKLSDPVAEGSRIETEESQRVVLTTPEGDRVQVAASGGLTLEKVETGEGGRRVYRFTRPSGEVVLDFRDQNHARLQLGSRQVMVKGTLRCRQQGDAYKIGVLSGEATVEGGSGPPRSLGRGQEWTLDGSGEG